MITPNSINSDLDPHLNSRSDNCAKLLSRLFLKLWIRPDLDPQHWWYEGHKAGGDQQKEGKGYKRK